MRFGLRAQMLLYLTLTLVVAAGLFGGLALHLMQRGLYNEWQRRWVAEGQRIASSRGSLEALLARSDQGDQLLVGQRLRELATRHPPLAAALRRLEQTASRLQTLHWIQLEQRRLLVGRQRAANGAVFALRTDFERFGTETRSLRMLVLGYLGLSALLALLVGAFLLQRAIAKPVDRMLATISGLSVAVMEQPLALDLSSDLHSLNRSISTVVETLRDKQERIQKHLEHLKRVNEELARTQDSLVQSEKLASVGQLAAGVAHEIGNPLSSILGYLELLRDPQTTEPERRDFFERISTETQRIHQIIQNLLTYARPSDDEGDKMASCDVEAVVASCVELVKPQRRFKGLSLRCEVDGTRPAARISAGKLQQVMVNLLFNAADALSGEPSAEPQVAIRSVRRESTVEIAVSDNGPGVPTEVARRIFDPFFTTKEPGSGTGLGLSISQQIVRHIGGNLRVEATSGGGATFVVELPLIAEDDGVAV